jgi:hypothetical protein
LDHHIVAKTSLLWAKIAAGAGGGVISRSGPATCHTLHVWALCDVIHEHSKRRLGHNSKDRRITPPKLLDGFYNDVDAVKSVMSRNCVQPRSYEDGRQ